MQTFSVLPFVPTQLRCYPWCWGLLESRAVGCAGPEHTIWDHFFLNPEFPQRQELAIWGQLPECLRQHEHGPCLSEFNCQVRAKSSDQHFGG